MSRPATQIIQKWGNSLAVRIPSTVAKSAHLVVGQTVTVSLDGDAVVVSPTGTPRLTLAQKLAQFDPSVHGGEAMATDPIGTEVI